MSRSQVEQLRALILKHSRKIASGFPSDEFVHLVSQAQDEVLLGGCLKLIVSFGLWVTEFLECAPVRLLSTNSPTSAGREFSDDLKGLLSEYGRLALDESEQMTLRQGMFDRLNDARFLALNLLDLKMTIASAKLVEAELPAGEFDELIAPADYQYLIHPGVEPLVNLMLVIA